MKEQAIYLDSASGPVAASFHPAPIEGSRDTAVLLCPPFGWEEVCSYRHLRAWAQQLAAAGYPTLRLSFPSTGDSAGTPLDPDRLEAWTDAVQSTARWLLDATGAQRTAVVGIELGGVAAYLAAAAGAPIDDLILWATPSRGRAVVRQLRAFSKLESARFFEGLEQPAPLHDGELEAGGFLLSAQTVSELEALDLTAAPLAPGAVPRVLLLGRDSLTVDARLQAALEQGDRDVTVASGDGYATMTSHPQFGEPALQTFERVAAWLDEASIVVAAGFGDGLESRPSAEIAVGDAASVRETQVTIEQPFGTLAGTLTEPHEAPVADLCVVLLNAGAIRRIGPNRMYVDAARRWAARGIPTLRLDVEGVGDADGDRGESAYAPDANFYLIDRIGQVRAAFDFLQQRGVANRFVVGGLCAGAYWAFHAALEDPRVDLALMVNPSRVVWDPGLAQARDLRRLVSERPSWSKIRNAVAEGRVRRLAAWMLASPKRAATRSKLPSAAAQTDALLEAFLASGKRLELLFAEVQPFEGELERSGWIRRLESSPAVTVEHIKVRDHTLRPGWAQREAHVMLDRALERELAVASPVAVRSR